MRRGLACVFHVDHFSPSPPASSIRGTVLGGGSGVNEAVAPYLILLRVTIAAALESHGTEDLRTVCIGSAR